MNEFPARIFLPAAIWQLIEQHVTVSLPEESCGLLGGVITGEGVARAERFLPVENELHSPVRFRMEPTAQLQAMIALEENGQEIVGIVHSHPRGPDHPSPTDLAEFAYPGVLSLIVCPRGDAAAGALNAGWQVRAYQIHGVLSASAVYQEVPVDIQTLV